ncbi:tetratricopeptide repeat protein [Pseudokineococcus lusitanus]|uniref:Putative thioredoxin n=1 Tax=Pseudokineococcus lusitanus TaxID=763993 RepID=A0A3N1HMZ9_9ACTN|nr:tetratricopeptide repeat protein [Pseudokineococcus lusitanus]ROP43851.1 putative thioredoxin [Pseudokineococcus lusitanus]
MSQRSGRPRPGGAPAGPGFDVRGAVDLSGLGRPAPAPAAAGPAGGGGAEGGASGLVVAVTEANFREVVEGSTSVPVVVVLSSPRAQGAADLAADLRAAVAADAGRWLLAEVDADASPQIAAAFQVQTVPAVLALVAGQPVPLFQGVLPAEQVRQYLDALLDLAQRQGVTGRLDGGAGDGAEDEGPIEPPLPPLHQEAYDAIERDDLDAAADAYRRALAEAPADEDARLGLAQVELLRRTSGVDLQQARAAAAADAADVDAALLVADLDVLGGHVEDAFRRLVATVRATSGDERDRVRVRLVELFEVVGAADPRVVAARRALASALF